MRSKLEIIIFIGQVAFGVGIIAFGATLALAAVVGALSGIRNGFRRASARRYIERMMQDAEKGGRK
jgi:ABC-type dipeptide/oligopeptide/nickel transport system permease subunit